MLPGTCRDGKRDDAHLESRSAATLDVDEDATALYGALCFGCVDVPFSYAWHTTRSHTEEAPRLRIVVPFDRPVSAAEYRRIVPALGAAFGVTYDPASIKPSQMMFLPVRNSGAPFESGSTFGAGFVDPDTLLSSVAVVERAGEPEVVNFDDGLDVDPEWISPRPEKIAELRSALLYLAARETGYDKWQTRGQNLKPLGEVGYGLWVEYSFAQADHDPDADLRGKWDADIKGDRSDYRAIFKAAGAAGWQKPAEPYVEPLETDVDGDRVNSFQLALKRAEAPIRSDLIKGVIPDAEFGIIYGSSGAGKSFAAIDLGYHLAQGRSWRGRKVKQRDVFYIAAEGAHGVRRRAKAYALHHGVDALTPFYTRERPINMHAKNGWVRAAEDINELRADDSGVIFIDTLSRSIPGVEENSAKDMSQVIENCQMLGRATGCMVIVIAHAGKDGEKGVRGSSTLRAAADFELAVTRHLDTPWRCLKLTKSKDDVDGVEFGFTLTSVEVGVDEENDPVFSAVAVPSDDRPAVVNKPQSKDAARALDAVIELADFAPDGWVDIEQVIDRVLDVHPNASKNARVNIRRWISGASKLDEFDVFDGKVRYSVTQPYSDVI
ncbi:AAA family ATPase [Paraburkholderia aspalathi]|nr:AAA family ATPase [Paraburkholderia aspalathi]MBK3817808.1 AAA family ATPase [Paraburkholderia aspalathi]MBK3829576.1 AAA family ATPase [Paraburkholderia aspalathi]MBK3859396.1 AAA family ATPase [Paraburkholderia aspalathi]